jgi:hypothetical protein
MKNIIIPLSLLLCACSEKPKVISTELNYHDFGGVSAYCNSSYSSLDAVIKLRRSDNEILWYIDVIDPLTGSDDMNEMYKPIRMDVFRWLKSPDALSKKPYLTIDFKDKNGFVLFSHNNSAEPGELLLELDDKEGFEIARLRSHGRFTDKNSKYSEITSCGIRIVADRNSDTLLQESIKRSSDSLRKVNNNQ